MRELSVVMPNGQSILVKCDVKSGGGDVFDMIVAHSNLVEHFYFGLAYIDGNAQILYVVYWKQFIEVFCWVMYGCARTTVMKKLKVVFTWFTC